MSNLTRRSVPVFAAVIAAAVLGGSIYAMRNANNASGADPNDPARVLSELRDGAAPEQQAALANGQVTKSEYEASVNATVGCLKDAGIAMESEPAWAAGRLQFLFVSGNSVASREAASAVYNGCYVKHQREIDAVWSMALGPANLDRRSDAEIAACYRANGVAVAQGATRGRMFEAASKASRPDVNSTCSAGSVLEEFGAE